MKSCLRVELATVIFSDFPFSLPSSLAFYLAVNGWVRERLRVGVQLTSNLRKSMLYLRILSTKY